MRAGPLYQNVRVIVFLKTSITDNNDFVAFKKMFKLMRHTNDGVVFEILSYKISNETVCVCIETAGFTVLELCSVILA
jgi:lipoprotein signal peptidase